MTPRTLVPLLLGGLVACSSTKTVYLTAGESLNPDPGTKAPTSVKVKVFQLMNKETFESADFDAVWNDPKTALGGDLVVDSPVVKDITPRPKGGKMIEIEVPFVEEKGLDPRTHFFGVAVLFNPPNDFKTEAKGDWKKVVAMDDSSSWAFEMDQYQVVLKDR